MTQVLPEAQYLGLLEQWLRYFGAQHPNQLDPDTLSIIEWLVANEQAPLSGDVNS